MSGRLSGKDNPKDHARNNAERQDGGGSSKKTESDKQK